MLDFGWSNRLEANLSYRFLVVLAVESKIQVDNFAITSGLLFYLLFVEVGLARSE
jgi:hypothetical protein